MTSNKPFYIHFLLIFFSGTDILLKRNFTQMRPEGWVLSFLPKECKALVVLIFAGNLFESLGAATVKARGAFHLGKKPGNFGGS